MGVSLTASCIAVSGKRGAHRNRSEHVVKPKLGNICGSPRRDVDAGDASRHAQCSFCSGGQSCRTPGSCLPWRRSSKRFGSRYRRPPEIIKHLLSTSSNGPERLTASGRWQNIFPRNKRSQARVPSLASLNKPRTLPICVRSPSLIRAHRGERRETMRGQSSPAARPCPLLLRSE